MKEEHKVKTTFSELSIEEKRRSIREQADFFKHERWSNKVIFKIDFRCRCKVPGIHDNIFANWIHQTIADHKPMMQCVECNVTMYDWVLRFHVDICYKKAMLR